MEETKLNNLKLFLENLCKSRIVFTKLNTFVDNYEIRPFDKLIENNKIKTFKLNEISNIFNSIHHPYIANDIKKSDKSLLKNKNIVDTYQSGYLIKTENLEINIPNILSNIKKHITKYGYNNYIQLYIFLDDTWYIPLTLYNYNFSVIPSFKLFKTLNENVKIIDNYDYLEIYEQIKNNKMLVIEESKLQFKNFNKKSTTSNNYYFKDLYFKPVITLYDNNKYQNFYSIQLLKPINLKTIVKRKKLYNYYNINIDENRLIKKLYKINLFFDKKNKIQSKYILNIDINYILEKLFKSKKEYKSFTKYLVNTFILNQKKYKKTKLGKILELEIKKTFLEFEKNLIEYNKKYIIRKEGINLKTIFEYENLFKLYNINIKELINKCKLKI